MLLNAHYRELQAALVLALVIGGTASSCSSGPAEPQPAGRTRAPATGPLKIHQTNPRYFADSSGKIVYLTGSHTWDNFQDRGLSSPPRAFDYEGYLDFLRRHGHTFIRLWIHENARSSPWKPHRDYFTWPLPYRRTGPGVALDGGLRFDLRSFDPTFFKRLRSRVREAQERGLYVSIMLFDGWSIEMKRPWGVANNPWPGHPFNRDNNINGIDGDLNGDGEGGEIHTLRNPAITALQDTYVRKVIDTVNDIDSVLYEIANESTKDSAPWQFHMIDLIHSYEAGKHKQHPVYYTPPWGPYEGKGSKAEAIADVGATLEIAGTNPDANDGTKVQIVDTDHIFGIGGDRAWVWKSFVRGLNPIYMDPYDEASDPNDFKVAGPTRDGVIKAMGDTMAYAQRINLARMTPRIDLCLSTYCLVDPGREYLVYLPSPGHPGLRWFDRRGLYRWLYWISRPMGWNKTVTVDLSAASGPLSVEWFNPRTHQTVAGGTTQGGDRRAFVAPFTGDAVLYISARAQLSLGPGVERGKTFSSSARGRTDEKSDGNGRGWHRERSSVA